MPTTQEAPTTCPVCGQPWLQLGAGVVTCRTRHGLEAVEEALRDLDRQDRRQDLERER